MPGSAPSGSGDYKFIEDGGLRFLFNVRTDPGERHDLASVEPARVRAMRELVTEWEKDVDAEAKAAALSRRPTEGRWPRPVTARSAPARPAPCAPAR